MVRRKRRFAKPKRRDLKRDKQLRAMKQGRRVSKGGSANQYGTKAQNRGNKYFETRKNRTDAVGSRI